MTNDIKKYYHYMDLSYDSSEEDVISMQRSLIKIARAKNIHKGINDDREIKKINEATQNILNFIKTNGVPNVECDPVSFRNLLKPMFFMLTMVVFTVILALLFCL